MCGICGFASVRRERPVDRDLVRSMLAKLRHRGPDGEGAVFGTGAALGHRRLAIIDLSDAAAQPFEAERGRVFASVNGEIYNHRALRGDLEAQGHRFRSHSDCEVVLHLYEEHGADFPERLEGMFAAAVWDDERERLVLARDRLGEKPLYYHEDAERIVFASEIGALLADRSIGREIDDLAIHHYLTFRFVPSPHTGIHGVRKLPPGCTLVWERGRSTFRRHGAPPHPGAGSGPESAAGGGRRAPAVRPEDVRGAIAAAVASRLESDVPIGILLSGGIDSAIVALETAAVTRSAVKTFTVSFAENDYDESARARLVAEAIGSEHHELPVRPDLAADLPEIVAHYGEPFGDSSAAAVWLLAREVRRHVKVALGGDGGDELFGGYDRYRALKIAAGLGPVGGGSILPVAAKIARLIPITRGRRNIPGRLDRFAAAGAAGPLEANGVWLSCFSREEKGRLCGAEFRARMSGVDSLDLLRGLYRGDGDFLDDVFYADMNLLLPDDLLLKVDIASMASSLEVRSPLLSRPLVDFAARIPSGEKVGRRRGKEILRRAYDGLLPAPIVRGRKAGFGLPVDRWLRGPLRAMVRDLIPRGCAVGRGYLDPSSVAELLDEHESGRANNDDRIWALLCLELWLRTFVGAGA